MCKILGLNGIFTLLVESLYMFGEEIKGGKARMASLLDNLRLVQMRFHTPAYCKSRIFQAVKNIKISNNANIKISKNAQGQHEKIQELQILKYSSMHDLQIQKNPRMHDLQILEYSSMHRGNIKISKYA